MVSLWNAPSRVVKRCVTKTHAPLLVSTDLGHHAPAAMARMTIGETKMSPGVCWELNHLNRRASMSGRVASHCRSWRRRPALPFATARATADLLEVPSRRQSRASRKTTTSRSPTSANSQQDKAAIGTRVPQPQNLRTKEPVPKKPADSTSPSREVALATRLESGVKLAYDSREASLEYFETKQNSDGRPQPGDAKISPDEVDRQIILGARLSCFETHPGEFKGGRFWRQATWIIPR